MSCITNIAPSHEPDTCTESWLSSLSGCVNSACPLTPTLFSTNVSSPSVTMSFAPKLQFSCQQSVLPGAANVPTGLSMQLQAGICADSPYQFDSFVPTMEAVGSDGCILEVFPELQCAGAPTTLSLARGDFTSGRCSFQQGNSVDLVCTGAQSHLSENAAAHMYLNQLCSRNHSSALSTSSLSTSGKVSALSGSATGSSIEPFATGSGSIALVHNGTAQQTTKSKVSPDANKSTIKAAAPAATTSAHGLPANLATNGTVGKGTGPHIALWIALVFVLIAWV